MLFPTLSEEGWIQSSSRIADKIMAHTLETDGSQSILFGKNIFSIADAVAKNNGDPTLIASEIREGLERIYKRYFSRVDVTVMEKEVDGGKYNLYIYINAVDKQTQRAINVGRLVEYMDTDITKVAKLNDGVL